MTALEQVEASHLVQSPLDSSDHAGGSTVVMKSGQVGAAPQIGHFLAAVGYTSSDGNIGGLKFKDQLMNKFTRKLRRLWSCCNKPLNRFVNKR